MILWKPPRILRKLYPELIWDFSSGNRTIYLTFDDGPTVDVTLKVIEVLNDFKACATFFCIGRNVEKYHLIFNAISDAGHAVGNHTYSHVKGWYTPDKAYFEDIDLASRFVQSRLFRPAYGLIKPSQVSYLMQYYKIIMWTLLSYDFHPEMTKEKCLDYVIYHTKPGSIVVFHDSLKASGNLLYVLPRMLKYFGEQGYTFSSIPSGPGVHSDTSVP